MQQLSDEDAMRSITEFAARAKGHRQTADPGWALRLLGIRDQVHPHDVYASLYDDEALAEEATRLNRSFFGHETYGPLATDAGWLDVADLRSTLLCQNVAPADPAEPDDAFT